MSLKADPYCVGVGALQQDWEPIFPNAFPLQPHREIAKKVGAQQTDMIIVAPVCVTQPWYPSLLNMAVEHPTYYTSKQDIICYRTPWGTLTT